MIRFIQRKEVWVLTSHGWLFFLFFCLTFILVVLVHLYSFLAPTSPIKADVLVVEGWMGDYGLKNAIKEFEKGGYQALITTGTPLGQGHYLSEYKSTAELAAATLIALGFDRDKLVAIPAADAVINRTAASAMALREWIAQSGLNVKSINLYSSDVHTRRSWLIFKQVLAPQIQVGVIAAPPYDYNPQKWWSSSQGVRLMISETIAYLYAWMVSWQF